MFTFVIWAIGLWIIYRIVMFLVEVGSEFSQGWGEGRARRREQREYEAWYRAELKKAERMAAQPLPGLIYCCACGAGNGVDVPFCYQCGKWMGGRRPNEAPVSSVTRSGTPLRLLRVLNRNEGETQWEFDKSLDLPTCPQNTDHEPAIGETQEAAAKAAAARSWNATPIRAEFVDLATSNQKDSIRLWYSLTNTTDTDYRIETMSGIVTAVFADSTKGDSCFLYAFNEGLISLEMPLIVPAHRSIRAMLTVALQTDKSVADDASEIAAAIYKKDVMTSLRSKYSRMKGFVLLDVGTGYEIDFPFAWPEAGVR
ncbi:MAG: hypothetical protein WCC04_10045 [Terriglobales bacterium]